jgi:hypothetical protein
LTAASPILLTLKDVTQILHRTVLEGFVLSCTYHCFNQAELNEQCPGVFIQLTFPVKLHIIQFILALQT